jgi:hypothetical protein
MTTRGQINSNFYQIVNVDVNGNPTSITTAILDNSTINYANHANHANYADNSINANTASFATLAATANIATLANTATTAITVTSNSQPNITSLGTLHGLTSSANIIAPYFIGNVVGNISGNIVVPGLNYDVLFNNGGNAGASDNLKFNSSTNELIVNGNVTSSYYSGNGSKLTNINGANIVGQVSYAAVANSVSGSNVSGPVAYATVANSVAVANVVGIGNIATINLNNSGSNVLLGNGAWGSLPNTATANYANFAGNITIGNQPNITSVGTLTDVTVSGNANVGNVRTDHLLYANGSAWAFGGNPGGSNTQLQFNNNGSFGGISTVTYNGSNISLGAINTVKITGGVANSVIGTDGTGNLSFQTIASSLTVGTRTVAINIPTTNYEMNVLARTGNVIVSVN